MKLRKLGIPILLTIVIAMSFMGRTFAYYQRKTSWSIHDSGKKKAGLGDVETHYTTSSTGYMQLYVRSYPLSWGKVWGYVEWEFTPTSTLSGVTVKSNMEADFKVFAFLASCEAWFTLEVMNTGKKDEVHWSWGPSVKDDKYKNEYLSIYFGTMYQGQTYRIRSTISFVADNEAWVDAESGEHGSYNGYANVIDQIVETSC